MDFTPKSTNEMVFSNQHTKALLEDIIQKTISFPANGKNTLLLYGICGSGKTTYADIFFKEYERSFGGSLPYVEKVNVDGSGKITSTIEKLSRIANFVAFNESNKHYFLFDEVDGYKPEQQQRLKAWLNRDDVVCIMTTNHIEKIDKGLLSRCHKIEFNAASNPNDYLNRMRHIIEDNNLPMLNERTLLRIVQLHKGDWRDICTSLQRTCLSISKPLPLNTIPILGTTKKS